VNRLAPHRYADTIATADREIPVRVHPSDAAHSRGVLVWAHGGSWRGGSAASWHPALADLARATGATVVAVDYRLAPAHRHPAALHDVLAALDWAAHELAPDVALSVGGDSAGATLAAWAALERRELGLAAQVLAYPPLDPTCAAASYRRDPAAFPRRADLMAAWRDYQGPEPVAPRAEFASVDLTGTAPAVIAVGATDPVADDGRAYARRLDAAGIAVDLLEMPDHGHGAFLVDGDFRRALADAYTRITATASIKAPRKTP